MMTADLSSPAWVVGVDGSPVADEAVSWAVRHATGRTRQIRLVTAWQASMRGAAINADIESREANEINTTAVAAARQLLPERGAHSVPAVDAQVIHGGASAVLLDASERGSLLIIGNRGRGALARLISGSTSNQCTAHAVVPTVVVPAHRDKVGGTIARADRLVVGLDCSPNSVAGLRWAVDFAERGCVVEAVTVLDPIVPVFEDRDANELRAIVDDLADAARERGVDVEHRFVAGVPRDTLVTAAESADLLVVGKRGAGAIGAALLGSVSASVLRHVDAPTVVVP